MPTKISSWFTHSQSSVQVVNSSLSNKWKFKQPTNYQLSPTNQHHRRFGFSLIELLVVITIAGVLASIITANVLKGRVNTRDATRKSDIESIKKALESFSTDTVGGGKFPVTITAAALVTNGYIKKVPTDPKTNTPYLYFPITAAGGQCSTGGNTPSAASNGDCINYNLIACLENAKDNGINTYDKPFFPSSNGSSCVGSARIYSLEVIPYDGCGTSCF